MGKCVFIESHNGEIPDCVADELKQKLSKASDIFAEYEGLLSFAIELCAQDAGVDCKSQVEIFVKTQMTLWEMVTKALIKQAYLNNGQNIPMRNMQINTSTMDSLDELFNAMRGAKHAN